MQRMRALLLCMLLICCTFTGCISNPALSSQTSEESSLTDGVVLIPTALPENFTITIPDGFQTTSSAAYNEYYVRDDASIIITDDHIAISGERLEDYMTKVKSVYEQTADCYALISEENPTINDVEASILEFSYAILGENKQQDMQCMVAVLIHHDVAYVITCKSLAQNFALYRGAFRSCIESIVIETPPENTEGAVTH